MGRDDGSRHNSTHTLTTHLLQDDVVGEAVPGQPHNVLDRLGALLDLVLERLLALLHGLGDLLAHRRDLARPFEHGSFGALEHTCGGRDNKQRRP